ncbi:hypothetical protein E4U43_008307 [Claviceps pusilla]|uniref:tRNA wybutosine-synthesizing protein 2 n=1 Tax=Claviceps pusilla TaxID=123648 RepID=A0A9P7NJ02_9HYPO|nr:hypothetical protein E4U43_008307 [Claviceps pusilla]
MPKPHPSSVNPIQTALSKWFSTISPPDGIAIDSNDSATNRQQILRDNAPKRFTVYEPMALLPAGSFSSADWTAELLRHSTPVVHDLWMLLLQELSKNGKSKQPLTHLAVNEGIPPRDVRSGTLQQGEDNVMRRPSSLRILHGDFGPSEPNSPPSQDDFDKAFWVSTKQNGIVQTWAPRWTMFSRGNVKEKTRLLQFPPVCRSPQPQSPTAAEGAEVSSAVAEDVSVWAVDLYSGIGYFTFCYAKLGMRVLCWELNPWSVEALRRGAEQNKWSVDIFHDPTTRGVSSEQIMKSEARIVVMAEDNGFARARTGDMKRQAEARRGTWLRHVRHVNCGLLPSSRPTWDCALSLTRTATTVLGRPQQQQQQTWLHLHENVGESEIERRRDEIQTLLACHPEEEGLERSIHVERVEKVKTYAPGVWHCVFDVLVSG